MAIIIDNLSVTRLSLVHDRLLFPCRATWLVQAVKARAAGRTARVRLGAQGPLSANCASETWHV
jgi:hypothetical protein